MTNLIIITLAYKKKLKKSVYQIVFLKVEILNFLLNDQSIEK